MSGALSFSDHVEILNKPIDVGALHIKNRLVVQPMEGCDGTEAGAPGELTKLRYEKLARGGAGLLWYEAVAVSQVSRANPRQLFINDQTVDDFKRLVGRFKAGSDGMPMILQATHSGRYAKPDGVFAPIIARHNPIFEGSTPLPESCVITDEALKAIPDQFAKAAKLTHQAGFDGIDVKACHGYLFNELLSAHTRPGPYGGCFENRVRLFLDSVAAVRAAVPSTFLTVSRLNIYDAFPHPYGFGAKAVDGSSEPDLAEAKALIRMLNMPLLDITMGNPYQNPQVNRPTDAAGVENMHRLTKQIQSEFPNTAIVASGFSWVREKAGALAAGAIESGVCAMAGFGRMSFAYPEFARDILSDNFDRKRMCVTCSKCSQLMRAGSATGCVLRNPMYTKMYQEVVGK